LRRTDAIVERDDGIADQLTGTVIGDVAAALDRHEVGSHRRRITLQVLVEFGPRTVREDVRMLEEQQMVVVAVLEQRGLERESLQVRNSAQPARSEHRSDLG